MNGPRDQVLSSQGTTAVGRPLITAQPARLTRDTRGIDRFRMVLARLHSSGRAERKPLGDSGRRIIHHVSLKDFVTLIELFGSPVYEGFIDEPGFWTVDNVCYTTPDWLELLA